MKKLMFLLFAVIAISENSNAQLKRVNTCVSDFEIKLDGTPVTDNGVTTFNIVAKPLLSRAEAIANAAGCQAQWVPTMFVGGAGSKKFTENFYPQILSITLPTNNGNFFSSNTPPAPNKNGVLPLQKGRWYSLSRAVQFCQCDCLNGYTQINFMLNNNNQLEVAKLAFP